MERALATIATVTAVEKHPDADLLEIVRVRGWQCVVRKADRFAVGDDVLYLEIDSHVDVADERFAFLSKGGLRTNAAGWRGHRVRTVQLRGVTSQGLIMPLGLFPELEGSVAGDDVTGKLPVRLWEPLIPFGTEIIGALPDGIPDTDLKRVQNFDAEELAALLSLPHLTITEKIDGSSCSAYVKDDGDIGVSYGKRWEVSPLSAVHSTVASSPAGRWLREQHPGTYLQGEIVGPPIQGNPLKLTGLQWLLFGAGYMMWNYPHRMNPLHVIPDDIFHAQAVPWIPPGAINRHSTVEDLIRFADGIRSMLNQDVLAEGIVITGYDDLGERRGSCKVINNAYLIANKE